MHADLIIAGAGAAGLALASRVHALAPDSNIIVLDRKFEGHRKQLWSYWMAEEDETFARLEPHVHCSWTKASVRFDTGQEVQNLAPLRYCTIRSEDYRRARIRELRQAAGVELVEAEILSIEEDSQRARVLTSRGWLSAPHLCQSVTLSPGDRGQLPRFPLRQQFIGYLVHSEEPLFDPSCFTWMDFEVSQELGLSFVYALPFDPHTLFIEFTVLASELISRSRLRAALEQVMAARLSSSVRARPREFGSIPMDDRALSPYWSGSEGPRRVFNIGAVGGMTKASTGYGFARSQRQAEHLARGLIRGRPTPLPASAARFRFYDLALLHMIHESPDAGLAFFRALLLGSDLRRVLRFLDEHSSWLDEARLIARLPTLAGLRSAGPALQAMRPRQRPLVLPEAA